MDWRPSPVQPELFDIPLTRVETGKYQTEVNKSIKAAVEKLDRDPKWQKMTPEAKRNYLEDVVSYAREGAKDRMAHQLFTPAEATRRRGEAAVKKREGK